MKDQLQALLRQIRRCEDQAMLQHKQALADGDSTAAREFAALAERYGEAAYHISNALNLL